MRESVVPSAKVRVVLGLAILAATGLLPTTAQAACRGGFCVSGHDEGKTHYVDFTTTWTNISHFNVSLTDGEQIELGANQREFTYVLGPSGMIEHYGLQACSGGGVFSKSRCTTWAYFTHTAP